jgi:outer membrane lipoprotein-sorting protein
MTARIFFASIASTLLALSSNVCAQTPEERAQEIAREMDHRNDGFVNSMHEATMILKNRHGEESVRHFTLKTLEVTGDGDKELGLFDNPPDVRGTAVLTYCHGVEPDDQWIYLPSLKRVKRISSANKSGPFVGSEFAFEDIASWQLAKFDYNYLRDETIDGGDCFAIAFLPKYDNSAYSKQIWFIDKVMYEARKIEYYDR